MFLSNLKRFLAELQEARLRAARRRNDAMTWALDGRQQAARYRVAGKRPSPIRRPSRVSRTY